MGDAAAQNRRSSSSARAVSPLTSQKREAPPVVGYHLLAELPKLALVLAKQIWHPGAGPMLPGRACPGPRLMRVWRLSLWWAFGSFVLLSGSAI